MAGHVRPTMVRAAFAAYKKLKDTGGAATPLGCANMYGLNNAEQDLMMEIIKWREEKDE